MNISKIILIILSVIMILPTIVAISGVIRYMEASITEPTRMENLIIVGFMILYSSVIFFPYLALLAFKWKTFERKILIVTSIPFLIMLCCGIFAELNGIPW